MSFSVTLQTAADRLNQLENNPPDTPQEIQQAIEILQAISTQLLSQWSAQAAFLTSSNVTDFQALTARITQLTEQLAEQTRIGTTAAAIENIIFKN